MKKPEKPLDSRWPHKTTIKASPDQMFQALGRPDVSHPTYHTIQYEWDFETDTGEPFKIHDWREYRIYNSSWPIEWVIEAKSTHAALQAKNEIETTLKSL
jgi:hypothetical protein